MNASATIKWDKSATRCRIHLPEMWDVPAGIECHYIAPLTRRKPGLKLFYDIRNRNIAYKNQVFLSSKGLAPRAGRRFTAKWDGDHWYGYRTEHALVGDVFFTYPALKVRYKKYCNWEDLLVESDEVRQLRSKLHDLGYDQDSHSENIGYLLRSHRFVLIDTGPDSMQR